MILESLEERRMLSVSVVENYPGFYQIDGDESADNIDVSVSQNNQSFTIDNVTYTDCYFISVFGNGGADTISLVSTDGSGNIGAGIDAGEGNDTITLNFDGAVYAGSGDDTLNLSDSFRGEAYGGNGDDHIVISGACINAEIQGEDGNDYIDSSANDYPVVVHGGAGNDTLIGSAYDDVLYGDEGTNSMDGGAGNDQIYSIYGSGDAIEGGSGFDILYANYSESSVSGIERTA